MVFTKQIKVNPMIHQKSTCLNSGAKPGELGLYSPNFYYSQVVRRFQFALLK